MPDAYDFWAARLPREDIDAINAFWDRFLDLAPKFERYLAGEVPDFDAAGLARGALGRLSKRLTCVVELGAEGQPRVVVTPELAHASRPLARAVRRRAPQLGGWEASEARAPAPSVPQAIAGILERSRSEAIVVEGIAPRRGAHRLVDLTGEGPSDPELIAGQTDVIFSVLLGEAVDRDWLGETSARLKPPPPLTQRLMSIVSPQPRDETWLGPFREAAEDIVTGFSDELPDQPFANTPMMVEEFTTLRLSPRDPDRGRRRDVTLYQTRYLPLTATRLAGQRAGAARFSRTGEIFGGLKIRLSSETPLREPANLATFASRVEERLMESRTGGVVARAVGLEHVYVDVALNDIVKGVQELKRTLEQEAVQTAAWLLFDDAGLEDLYLPLTPKTPPTPLD